MKLYRWIVAIVLLCILVSALPATVLADPASSDTTSTSSAPASLSPDDFTIDKNGEFNFQKYFTLFTDFIMKLIDIMGRGLVNTSSLFTTHLQTTTVADAIYKFFFPIGTLIMFISWSTSIGKKAMDGSLFDLGEGGGKKALIGSFTTLIAGLLIISVSRSILLLIDGIMVGLADQMFSIDLSAVKQAALAIKLDSTDPISKIPIIGWIINLVTVGVTNIFNSIALIVFVICLLVMIVVLVVRTIKLAMYQGFSPLFFGLSTNEETKQFFIRFIVNYTMLSAQIVVISALVMFYEAAIYMVLSGTLLPGFPSPFAACFSVAINILFTILLCKSSKILPEMIR